MTDRPFDHLLADIPADLAGTAARQAADDAAYTAINAPGATNATANATTSATGTALAALLDSVEALEASGLPQPACAAALMLALARTLADHPHTIDEDALLTIADAARDLAQLPDAAREARLRTLAGVFPPTADE